MPIIEYDAYKQKLGAIGPRLEKLAAALDLEGARREVEELEEKTNDPNFWNDVSSSQKVLQRTKQLKNKLEHHARLVGQWEDLTTLVEMAMEEDDASLLPEIDRTESEIDAFRKQLIDGHIERLNQGACRPESSGVFINLVSNLERLGDHLTYIAHTVQQ